MSLRERFKSQGSSDHAPTAIGNDFKTQPLKHDKPAIPSIAAAFPIELDEHEGPFPLHLVEDPKILDWWHKSVLQSISSKPDEFDGLNAIHLASQGPTKEMATPTIFASIDHANLQTALRPKISSLISTSEGFTVKLIFEVSAVRRTMLSQPRDPPPICRPTNTSTQDHPDSGASIGIQDRVDSTATLGGYLSIDGRLFGVTVDHLIPDGLEDEEIHITHPSQQDKMDVSRWHWLTQSTVLLEGYCASCLDVIQGWCYSDSWHIPSRLEHDGCSCRRIHSFKDIKERVVHRFKPERLGTVHCRSGTRSRPSVTGAGKYVVEMDWLLFSIDSWPRPLTKTIATRSETMSLSPVVPGAIVFARGRTSGSQPGMINTAMSLVGHGGRFTQEWSVIQVPNTSLDYWICNGIGVDGDSGSWLLDYDSDGLYGMVWGRDQAWTNPISLFTPIEDMLTDIKERMGATDICLPEYSSSASEIFLGKGKGKLETAPIKIEKISTGEMMYEGSYSGGKSKEEA